ncbi:MAG TPA: DUF362 domain-containing protein [Vicinamibacteria bacterium]|nr:DUF362 domain-containing protein [Vicinamibacteria bacterium]
MSDDRQANVTRRDFVRGTVGAALGVSVVADAALARGARSSRVVLVREEAALDAQHAVDVTVLRRMLGDLVMRVTGKPSATEAWRALVTPADAIGLVTTDHLNPTHPELTAAVREALVAAGTGADRIHMAQGGPDAARACTALLALPALKAHWLTGIGTVLKNYIQYSGSPSSYHGANNVRLGEIWLLPHVKGKTRLVVVDALRPLCDKGPQPDPRYMWNYNALVGGTDPVAVETVCLRIIEAKRRALRGEPWPLSPPPLCVAAADETYGLGTSRWPEIALERAGWSADALV